MRREQQKKAMELEMEKYLEWLKEKRFKMKLGKSQEKELKLMRESRRRKYKESRRGR